MPCERLSCFIFCLFVIIFISKKPDDTTRELLRSSFPYTNTITTTAAATTNIMILICFCIAKSSSSSFTATPSTT